MAAFRAMEREALSDHGVTISELTGVLHRAEDASAELGFTRSEDDPYEVPAVVVPCGARKVTPRSRHGHGPDRGESHLLAHRP